MLKSKRTYISSFEANEIEKLFDKQVSSLLAEIELTPTLDTVAVRFSCACVRLAGRRARTTQQCSTR